MIAIYPPKPPDDILQRLTAAYEVGRLVPFIGGGMSYPNCPLWKDLVGALEKRADLAPDPAADPAALVRRANRAVSILRNRPGGDLKSELRAALGQGGVKPSARTAALASIWWPLVITTNYDDWYYGAATEQMRPRQDRDDGERRSLLTLLGRSPQDCWHLLDGLRSPRPPILWALQGFLGGQHPTERPDDETLTKLAEELVFGHHEYRHVTHNSPHFRRAFAEVFRSRSLWFLGSGLGEPYFHELFGEVLELLGPNPEPHYAFALRNELDRDFLASRFNINVVEYEDHECLPAWIEAFGARRGAARPRQVAWHFSLTAPARIAVSPGDLSLQVSRSELPSPAAGQCIALSAGFHITSPHLGRQGRGWVEAYLPQRYEIYSSPSRLAASATGRGSYVLRVASDPVYVVVARRADERGGDSRDARVILDATRELMSCAAVDNFELVHAGLLAAGPKRNFSPVVSFIQMVRGLAEWYRTLSASQPSKTVLRIHVVDPSVLFALASRRIDITELLTCREVRFWVEISRSANDTERHQFFLPPETKVTTLLGLLSIPAHGWQLDVQPRPTRTWEPLSVQGVISGEDQSIQSLGVVPGSLLRLVQQTQDVR